MEVLKRIFSSRLCRPALAAIASSAFFALTCLSTAGAQQQPQQQSYLYDPSAADEQTGIKYFGAAKDAKGALLKDVTFQLVTSQSTFVFVTDDQGRFRGSLPLGTTPEKVTSTCFKAGFQMTRIDVRQGPKAPKPTVEVNCFLRSTS
jgi:hypothetical protein